MKKFFGLPSLGMNCLMVLPLAYVLLDILISWCMQLLGMDYSTSNFLQTVLGMPFLIAYYFLPSFGPIVVPVLAVSNVLCFRKDNDRKHRIFYGLNLLVLLLYLIYLVWWYITGQKLDWI